jgi:hypothetical protein
MLSRLQFKPRNGMWLRISLFFFFFLPKKWS